MIKKKASYRNVNRILINKTASIIYIKAYFLVLFSFYFLIWSSVVTPAVVSLNLDFLNCYSCCKMCVVVVIRFFALRG